MAERPRRSALLRIGRGRSNGGQWALPRAQAHCAIHSGLQVTSQHPLGWAVVALTIRLRRVCSSCMDENLKSVIYRVNFAIGRVSLTHRVHNSGQSMSVRLRKPTPTAADAIPATAAAAICRSFPFRHCACVPPLRWPQATQPGRGRRHGLRGRPEAWTRDRRGQRFHTRRRLVFFFFATVESNLRTNSCSFGILYSRTS